MNITFSAQAWEEYLYWQSTDPGMVTKINDLLKVIQRTPFEGIGKPEALKHGLKGFWSRRITQEHRLVYRIVGERGMNQVCEVAQCRYHYTR
ncbi:MULTISPECIES: Txe/YoeB family addiction module toxin [Rufibacter]|uniref:Txe/YoeB family addiction module toxin n=1 Tax=Rufibacter TaxID=1379908 RepID=UPI00083078D7|nr:Txe/YoeB family addiction module toxin [Rufibacter ruber]